MADMEERAMKIRWVLAVVATSLVGTVAALAGQAAETMLEPMPARLETQFALSAVPPGLRGALRAWAPPP
jgi:hypothetical protein